jgi:hypothetical protein
MTDGRRRMEDTDDGSRPATLPVRLLGDEDRVPCIDGRDRVYLNLDSAASTSALPEVADRVQAFLPWYSSVHRGAGYKSRRATAAYEEARWPGGEARGWGHAERALGASCARG